MTSRRNQKKVNPSYIQNNQIIQEIALSGLRDLLQSLNQNTRLSNIKTKIEKIKKGLGTFYRGQFKIDLSQEINNEINKIDSNTPISVVSALNVIGETFNLGNNNSS